MSFIKGKRIILRDMRREDLTGEHWDAVNDDEIMQFSEQRHFPITKGDFFKYWKDHYDNKNEPWFIIKDISNKLHIGNIKLGPINWIHRRADVSLWIYKEWWNKGYGTEAIKLIVNYAFNKLNLHKLQAGIYRSNVGSIKAFTKAGFRTEAILKAHVWFENQWEDVIEMVIRTDWPSMKIEQLSEKYQWPPMESDFTNTSAEK